MTLFDVIVIGAGHAGCEAAVAAAALGAKTLLITGDMEKIAQMSCNPAVGGIAKGQIVREIDALGGLMGIQTDRNTLQFRMLNLSKGPAMWSPRAQCDRMKYSATWRKLLENQPNLEIWQDEATAIEVDAEGHVCAVRTMWGASFPTRTAVVCAGTFLNGLLHVGRVRQPGGRVAEPPATRLTASLGALGIEHLRMKTGTPVRIDARTVHFEDAQRQDGDAGHHRFSFLPTRRPLNAMPCWTLETNPEVHAVLAQSLDDSPLFNGQIQSIGPRYCPSIETKITTFPDRTNHPLFLEPEGADTNQLYLNGFSSSLPLEAQLAALRHIPALRDARCYRPGYAIEYDFFPPTQLLPSLEAKKVPGLYLAGQVNGTTGYEEAGGQGLLAGINAARHCTHLDPVILGRDEAYIGVLVDDLVTKGVDEPYRMFTSRAEYRILLRGDASDARLTPISSRIGLCSTPRQRLFEAKQEIVGFIENFCQTRTMKPSEINNYLQRVGSSPLERGARLSEIVCRPDVKLGGIVTEVPELHAETDRLFADVLRDDILLSAAEEAGNDATPVADLRQLLREEILETAETKIKYAGYIQRERQQAEKAQRLEDIRLSETFDYAAQTQLSTEARQKLSQIRPRTLAQASRIPGVSPSDVNVLLILLGR